LGTLPATRTPTTAVTHVYGKLPAQDVERARAFYAEKLGLTPYGENHQHLYYSVAGGNFIIFPSTGQPSGTHDQLGLVVEDVGAEVKRLKSRDVIFETYPPPPAPRSPTESWMPGKSKPPASKTAKAASSASPSFPWDHCSLDPRRRALGTPSRQR
jgi:catechol 2,3-dioxygenase-like lactoylglutathione lyase family enzyme